MYSKLIKIYLFFIIVVPFSQKYRRYVKLFEKWRKKPKKWQCFEKNAIFATCKSAIFFFTFSLSKLYVSTKEIILKMRLSHYTHTSASNCQLLWALNYPTNFTMEKNYLLHKRLTSKHTDNHVSKLSIRISKLKNVILSELQDSPAIINTSIWIFYYFYVAYVASINSTCILPLPQNCSQAKSENSCYAG